MKKLFLLFCLTISLALCGQVTVNNQYRVKLDIKDPILPEKFAQKELKKYLSEIFGTPEEVLNRASGPAVILKYDKSLGLEEFKIAEDKAKNIIISGGRIRGVLFGVYYFLDRKLGVHWYSPYDEYVPKANAIKVDNLPYIGKPTFEARLMLAMEDRASKLWQARNLIASFSTLKNVSEELGEVSVFAPPNACHGMFRIIPGAKYYKHPEFFALINGKRQDPLKITVSLDFCLTNQGLIDATIKECRNYLKQAPYATYISIQEGDGTIGNCECDPCQKLKKACGNRESARWVYFANKVGEALKDEFPKVKFLIFAYTASKEPPKNIKANNNVAVQLCAWGNHRGKPYGDPKNPNGNSLLRQLKEWKEVCQNILIWDYTYTFSDCFLQTPDMLLNIDNIKSFAEFGANGYFPEDNYPLVISFGLPFKSWLLARAMWNPNECDGQKLEETFCFEYYGKEAGKYVLEYYRNLRKVHHNQGFVAFTGGGSIGTANFEKPEVTAYSLKLFQQALAAAKGNRVYKRRIKETLIPVQYRALIDYQRVKKVANLKQSPRELADSIINYLRGKMKSQYLYSYYNNGYIKRINSLIDGANIKADTNKRYGMNLPAKAYDGKFGTCWHSGSSSGWVQIEFDEKRPIQRITTCFYEGKWSKYIDHQVDGSFDGQTWFPIVKRNKSQWNEKYYYHFTDIKLDQLIEAKFVRTTIFDVKFEVRKDTLMNNDALIKEQWFNLMELPELLVGKDAAPRSM